MMLGRSRFVLHIPQARFGFMVQWSSCERMAPLEQLAFVQKLQ